MSKQEAEIERVYTVPLSRAWITARHKRTKRAVRMIREFAEHHMKSSEIKIDTELNEELWRRGITKPPRRITVKMEKDEDGLVTISLPKKAKKTQAPSEESAESPAAETSTVTDQKAALPLTTPTPPSQTAPVGSSAAAAATAPAQDKQGAPKEQQKKPAARKKSAKKSE